MDNKYLQFPFMRRFTGDIACIEMCKVGSIF